MAHDEQLSHCLDERRRSAYEGQRALAGRPGDTGEHGVVHAAGEPAPAWRLTAGQRVARLGTPPVLIQLLPVDDVRERRDEYSSRTGTLLLLRWRCRRMARSGTTPDPPAISSSGPPWSRDQVNQPPIGPRTAIWSPGRSSW